MGELFNISEEISSNRFEKLQEKYPNLRDFKFDNNILSYNGNSIENAEAGINHTAPIFFQMIPSDIFDYLKDGFYYQSDGELEKVKSMLSQEMIITEEEAEILKKFARDYLRKIQMYANNEFLFKSNPDNPDLENFLKDLKIRKDIMTNLGNNMSIAANIINNEVNNMTNNIQEQTQTQNQEQNQHLELDRGFSRTRTNPNFNYRFREQDEIDAEDERKNRLGLAGFSNIVLILVSALTFGMFIAVVTLGL